MKPKLKKSTIILIVTCFLCLSALLYPTLSDYWNRTYATHAISSFTETVAELEEEDYQPVLEEAIAYNAELLNRPYGFSLPDEMKEQYWHCLNVLGTGIMGYVEIPKIDIVLPLYHGTSDTVLNGSVGHIEWSSLPVGGTGTHSVLSGHRGLATAKLFTDLDRLREGDQFLLNILNETLTYEVDQIRTVEPQDVDTLAIAEGKDYCTLVTCTPYGINTHRLLVRGHRVETVGPQARVVAEAVLIDKLMVAVFLAIPVLFILLMAVMLKKPQKKVKWTLADFDYSNYNKS